jgi:hypothetical protein
MLVLRGIQGKMMSKYAGRAKNKIRMEGAVSRR